MCKSLIMVVAFIFFFYSNVKSQINIQTTVPTVGLIQKNQLWNLLLINGTAQTFSGRIALVLRERQSGNEMMSAVTTVFILNKGSLQTNVNMLSPIQYNYTGMEPNSMNGLLPVGSYDACFSFMAQAGSKQEKLAEECISFDIEPLSPPMLMFPNDSALLDIQPSQFTWIPPTPAGMINRLRYEILITEIKVGQKPAEALQNNIPFYNSADIRNNFLTYPGSLLAFEKDTWYAWQVIARDGSNYAAKTEAWVFNTQSVKFPKPDTASVSYIVMSPQKKSGISFITDHELSIKYYSFDSDRNTIVRFFSADGKLVKQVRERIIYGDNFLRFKVNGRFRQGQVYIIEITDEQKNIHKALFSIK